MPDPRQFCVDDYPNLSRPFNSMKTEYDVVVVGSGYGSGVAASRMARAGKSVAVLELGWERRRKLICLHLKAILTKILAGSYPESLSECISDFRISGKPGALTRIWKCLPSSPTQFFQLVLGDGQHVFSSVGPRKSHPRNARQHPHLLRWNPHNAPQTSRPHGFSRPLSRLYPPIPHGAKES